RCQQRDARTRVCLAGTLLAYILPSHRHGVGDAAMAGQRFLFCAVICFLAGFASTSVGQDSSTASPLSAAPSVIAIPPESQASSNFDPEAATNAYLAEISPAAKARSDAYFEGGYWLILWDFVYGVVIALLILNLRWSARMRNLAERITRRKPL